MSQTTTGTTNGQTNGETNGTVQKVSPEQLQQLVGQGLSDSDREYIETVLSTEEIASEYLDHMSAELARAHQLANRSDAEFHEFKQLVYHRTFEFVTSHPPANSKMTGPFRALVYGDGKQPLARDEVRTIHGLEQLIVSKATGGKQMEQQSIVKEMRQDVHRSTEDRGSGGGFISRLMGGN
jgi:hypothetical protein